MLLREPGTCLVKHIETKQYSTTQPLQARRFRFESQSTCQHHVDMCTTTGHAARAMATVSLKAEETIMAKTCQNTIATKFP